MCRLEISNRTSPWDTNSRSSPITRSKRLIALRFSPSWTSGSHCASCGASRPGAITVIPPGPLGLGTFELSCATCMGVFGAISDQNPWYLTFIYGKWMTWARGIRIRAQNGLSHTKETATHCENIISLPRRVA